jgi:hypothetical protein
MQGMTPSARKRAQMERERREREAQEVQGPHSWAVVAISK